MRHTVFVFLVIVFLVSACGQVVSPPVPLTETASQTPLHIDSSQPVSEQVENLLEQMTLEEKIGQMTQVEKNSIQPGDITKYFITCVVCQLAGPDLHTALGNSI